jgi:hypothetical protein
VFADRAQVVEFLRSEHVDEQVPHGGHVAGRGGDHLLPALLGEHRVDEPAVARAGFAADPAAAFHAADHV